MSSRTFRAPMPYFGGKSSVAADVWARLGSPSHYIEPFAGSLAVLLGRPGFDPTRRRWTETVNDADGLLCNFWRAASLHPDATAEAADWPVSELDLHARHAHLIASRESITERLRADPRWCDPEIAGWWVWGQCAATLGNWCAGASPGRPSNCPPRGVLTGRCRMDALAQRLSGVRVMCGDWVSAVATPSALGVHWHSTVGVFLDPPYSNDLRATGLYACHDDGSVAADVLKWAAANGSDSRLRICVAGYDIEHSALESLGWTVVSWRSHGGLGASARVNASRERLWFSPNCLRPDAAGAQGVLL